MINLSVRKQTSEVQELNMTAMCDVIFLLLIYMMFTTKPEVIYTVLDVSKPAADKSITSPGPQIPMVEIIILQKEYRICGKRVDVAGLEGYLHQLAEIDSSQNIILKCAPDSAHEQLIETLNLCNLAKLNNIAVMSM
ncbi:MAG: hypothetical protein A2283_13345 [Lentisphaerae bacterium RIFOXYA12_FULL_48_11]|nr:MAG: hypothetical protein A2283_13345 [Lentisphaerae bacterium RIFOXYA12_FULL_48_11]